MTSLDKAIIASYEKGGKRFELYVDPDNAYAYVEKKKPDLKNILVAEEVYADAKKGERAKAGDVEKVFGTSDIMKILEFILDEGEVQLTTDRRRKKVEEKRKQVVAILLREAIDPRTSSRR
jgi:ribosome maturation protein SDO1